MQVKTNSIDRSFDQFITTFRYKNVTRYDDMLVYRCPYKYAKSMCDDANVTIIKLNLPLVAIPSNLQRCDSFCVKSNEIFDI